MSNVRTYAWLWLVTWCGGLTAASCLDDPRRRFLAFILAFAVSTGAWLILGRYLTRMDRRTVRVAIGLGIGFRVAFIFLAPAFSEDVFRYVYEGRLVWFMGPGAPFAFPPADAPALGVPTALLDEAWLRINHPEISTIYPPFAQAVFAFAGGLSILTGAAPLVVLKTLIVFADVAAWRAIAHALSHRGRPVAESLWYGLCPLVIWEGAHEGHADPLSALGLSVAIWGFVAARPRAGYVGFALAALAKLNGLVVLPAALRSTRRGAVIAAVLLLGLGIPFALAGADAGAGLTQYATRWRAGDGVFSILLAGSEAILGGDWARVGPWTITQHQLARALTGLSFGTFALVLLARPAPAREIPRRAAWLLVVLLLLSPTLHPWYAIWLVPFLAAGAGPRPALMTLIALAPLLHYAGHRELITGLWDDPAWLRASVHGPAWLALLIRNEPRHPVEREGQPSEGPREPAFRGQPFDRSRAR